MDRPKGDGLVADEQRQGDERRGRERRRRVPGPPGPPGGEERRQRTIGWRSRDVLRAALLVAAVYLGLRLLWIAHSLFFVAFLGILFGLALSAGVDRLKQLGVPRAVGAVLIVLVFISAVTGSGRLIAPTLREQTENLREQLPAAVDRLERWLEQQQGGVVGVILGVESAAPGDSAPPRDTTPAGAAPAAGDTIGARPDTTSQTAGADTVVVREETAAEADQDADGAISLRERVTGELGSATRYLFPFLSSTIAVLGGALMILFIAIYIAVQPKLYRGGLMHLFPHRSRKRAGEVFEKMAIMLQRWLITQMVAMVAVGAITVGVLMLLKVPSALALGVLAGLLEFIPIIGPIIASIPAIIMAFIDSPQKALAVTIAFIVIQQIESQLITPLLMKEGVDLPPVMTLVVQAIMATVFGFIGLLVAVPLLATAMVPIKMLYVEDIVGDEMTLPGDEDD